jgi:hypothetical protein
MRAWVEALLRAHDQAGSFLAVPPVAGLAILDAPPAQVFPAPSLPGILAQGSQHKTEGVLFLQAQLGSGMRPDRFHPKTPQ